MWDKILGFLSYFPTAAAMREKHETQIMLLNAKHEVAIRELQTRNTVLEDENANLRSELEKKNEEINELHTHLMILSTELEGYEDGEKGIPPIPGADAGM